MEHTTERRGNELSRELVVGHWTGSQWESEGAKERSQGT